MSDVHDLPPSQPRPARSRDSPPAPHPPVRVLCEAEGYTLRLSWYAPGLRMPRHAHARLQVSLLLSGTLAEAGCGDDVRLDAPAVGVKPAGLVHANDYGPRGALVLAFDLDETHATWRSTGLERAWRWRPRPANALLARSRALLAQWSRPDPVDAGVEVRAIELLAAMGDCDDAPRGLPPAWIRRVSARLVEETTSLTHIARDEGLHPVYVARAFLRWKACAPSTFRARARLQQALAAMSRGSTPAVAALDAHYADQAHFTRAARAHTGLSPRQLRILLR